MARRDDGGREYYKYLGLGFEFAAIACLGFFVGNWIDQRRNSAPWGLLIGGMVGLTAGIYRLAREGLKAMDRLSKTRERDADDGPGERSP